MEGIMLLRVYPKLREAPHKLERITPSECQVGGLRTNEGEVEFGLYNKHLLDNLYSLKAWVTCTSHVHEDTSLKTRQIKVKKTRY